MYDYFRSYQHFSIPLYLINKCLDSTVKTAWHVDELPEKQGCYLLICADYVLYVGESENLKQRWETHHIKSKKIVNGLVENRKLADYFYLEYYLTDTHNGFVRTKLEDFLKKYYWPILCGHYGKREYILPIINSDILEGCYQNIRNCCGRYYKDRIENYDWKNRCAEFYHSYHRFFGTFESCQEQISQVSKIKKCLDISPFFPSDINPNNSVRYAKFE